MTATLTSLADAVVTKLNSGSWSQTFTAVRTALPEFDIPTLQDLNVVVASRGSELEAFTRSSNVEICNIEIGVLKKLDDATNASVDPYINLVDEIVKSFFRATLTGFSSTLSTVVRPDPVYDAESLEKKNLFVSIIQLEFRIYP